MKTSVINFKINNQNKKVFEMICDILGISTSSALNMYINKVINLKGIPFELKVHTNEQQEKERLRLALETYHQCAPTTKEKLEKQGIKTDDDVANMVMQMRRSKRK